MRLHRNLNSITPEVALNILKKGNFRFMNNLKYHHDLLEQVNETKDGQWPFATILSCIDSRSSAELIFDQGLGDIFNVRIAGQVITKEILGCLEYATAVVNSRLIVVLGHTNCGAIKSACDHVKMGNITALLQHIHAAVEQEKFITENRTGSNVEFVSRVASIQVRNCVRDIVAQSEIIKGLVEEGKVGILPAMYDVATGLVTFYEEDFIVKPSEVQQFPSI